MFEKNSPYARLYGEEAVKWAREHYGDVKAYHPEHGKGHFRIGLEHLEKEAMEYAKQYPMLIYCDRTLLATTNGKKTFIRGNSNQTIEGMDLEKLYAAHAGFYECKFNRCNLRGAMFYHASLKKCSFKSCDLTGARFDYADLTNSFFDDCKLDGAVFRGSVLLDSYLNEEEIKGCNFVDAVGNDNVVINIPAPWFCSTVTATREKIWFGLVSGTKGKVNVFRIADLVDLHYSQINHYISMSPRPIFPDIWENWKKQAYSFHQYSAAGR